MGKRNGLLLDRSGEVSEAIQKHGLTNWDFKQVSDLASARKTAMSNGALVGLVVFDTEHPWPVRDIESLVAMSGIEWIAILPPQLLDSQRLRPVVLRSFLDFHTLPLDFTRLSVTLGHAHGKAFFCRHPEHTSEDAGSYGMTGRDPKMLALYRQIEKIVNVDAPVLIGGESGTGKELVARAIHQHSDRANGPFIAMNCGAIAPNLIHSELFGHERGAFTGAHQRKIGNIEAANGGVLFLDEIGDLPLDLQASMLRFLQEKIIVRLGSTERLRMNVRVIAATHVDLQQAVHDGRFREDLFYRLNVLHLKVPPLRERASDIPLLANAIFNHQLRQYKSPQLKGFSLEALQAMHEYNWPGNVRELINRIQHAMIMSENKLINAADLGLPHPTTTSLTLDEIRASVEKEVIVSTLQRHQNNVSEVARQLGVSRVTLYRMIDRLKIIL